MNFNPTVFEKLLFPLNGQVYKKLQDALDEVDRKHPGKLEQILSDFSTAAQSDTQTETWRPGRADEATYPSLDISILLAPMPDPRISLLHKSTDFKITFDYKEQPPSDYSGSHLVVGFYHGTVLNSFIVPLEYLLGFNEKAVLKEGSYQLYSHTILSPDHQETIYKQMETVADNGGSCSQPSVRQFHQKNSLVYVGITKQTWQERYRQHCQDMGRGSGFLFHRALRGEFCQIGSIEHIVERAGLTEKQAMEIEEKEVEKRSLHSLYPNGLNMIPGGYAGLRCIHKYAARTGYALPPKISADNLEAALFIVQKHILKKHYKTSAIERANAEIARLWAEDLKYRINVMTGGQNRFSYRQIQAARIWNASGWPNEKILENLKRLDTKEINMEQLEQLLKGKAYATIPDVLI